MTERWQEIVNGLRRMVSESDYDSKRMRIAAARFDFTATFVAEQAGRIAKLEAQVNDLESQIDNLNETVRRGESGYDD